MTEKQWARVVIGLAKTYGYRVQHTWISVHSPSGYPDLTLVRPATERRPGRIVWAELKTETGRLTEAQQEWIATLAAAGGEVHVWRPADLERVAEILRGDPTPRTEITVEVVG